MGWVGYVLPSLLAASSGVVAAGYAGSVLVVFFFGVSLSLVFCVFVLVKSCLAASRFVCKLIFFLIKYVLRHVREKKRWKGRAADICSGDWPDRA